MGKNIFPESKSFIVYHANCNDGYCSYYILKKFMDQEDNDWIISGSLAANYGDIIPGGMFPEDIVYILDFSYTYEQIVELCNKVQHVFILDHHKTAKEMFAKLLDTGIENLTVFYDVNRSGAVLTYDFTQCLLDGNMQKMVDGRSPVLPIVSDFVPNLFEYVQDRDLWRWDLPYSEEINAYIGSMPYSYSAWDQLYVVLQTNAVYIDSPFVQAGSAILRHIGQQVKKAVKQSREASLQTRGYDVLGAHVGTRIVNTTTLHSEIGHALCKEYDIPFSVTWFQRPDKKFQYELRSIGDFDVSEVAKCYGGGGHKNAAGFVIERMLVC
jgi:oligoribonuclease NrnB/cAMP/cGMP phosphodiesterase (DHH superfamily)